MTEHENQATPSALEAVPDMAMLAGQVAARAKETGIQLTGTDGLLNGGRDQP